MRRPRREWIGELVEDLQPARSALSPIALASLCALLPLAAQILLGTAAIGGGVWLIRLSMIEIDRAGTTYDPYAPTTRLVTSGIYRHIRNPGYLGLAVIQLGFAILLDNYWIVVTLTVALLIMNFFVVLREEDKLRRTFGKDYEAFCSSSRRWI